MNKEMEDLLDDVYEAFFAEWKKSESLPLALKKVHRERLLPLLEAGEAMRKTLWEESPGTKSAAKWDAAKSKAKGE